jgi:DNA-binding PadR family transcriptional regulator
MYNGAMYYERRWSLMSWSRELVAASATPLVLTVLSQGENYGYGIIKRVAELTDGEAQWTDGMLYPLLHRLEKQRYLESEWRNSKSGRQRKYYRLRNEGKKELAAQRRKWGVINNALISFGEAKPCLT